ncbi:hypothetical protein [Hymenobacter metallicola]|uniref:Uncharacterized protein n=1 Tax=Hymenobacter metallicola TaxID=2563114 RepID=A0A4Z0QKK7_9BACT|nr:hypothetical protein [Hymenobacter metallicola]TGE29783.1 hypothetical protein E5K02_10075 [Hymenobacter metallicola]
MAIKAPKALPTGIVLAVFFLATLADYYLITPLTFGWLSYGSGFVALPTFLFAVYGAFTNERRAEHRNQGEL